MTSVSVKERMEIREAIRQGGTWLGEARSYVQRTARNGETVIWGSEEAVTLTMRQIEELALAVAVAAIGEDRVDCDRPRPTPETSPARCICGQGIAVKTNCPVHGIPPLKPADEFVESVLADKYRREQP